MNDFTKKELEILDQAVYHLWKDIPKDIPVDISGLPNKIQSLIDNYCEHENKETLRVNDWGEGVSYRCKDCRKIISREES